VRFGQLNATKCKSQRRKNVSGDGERLSWRVETSKSAALKTKGCGTHAGNLVSLGKSLNWYTLPLQFNHTTQTYLPPASGELALFMLAGYRLQVRLKKLTVIFWAVVFLLCVPVPECIRKSFPRVLMIDRADKLGQCCEQPQGLSK